MNYIKNFLRWIALKEKINSKNVERVFVLQRETRKGFTLVEMLVTLSIFSVLVFVLLNNDFSARRRLDALSFDVEAINVDVRDMQNRTMSFIDSATTSQYVGYGIYINMGDINGNKTVKSFFKSSASGFVGSEIPGVFYNPLPDYILTNNNLINKINLYTGSATTTLDTNPSTNKKVAIYFVKPKPYVYIYQGDNSNNFSNLISSGINSINRVCIELKTTSNEYKRVDIYYIGQISTGDGQCPN